MFLQKLLRLLRPARVAQTLRYLLYANRSDATVGMISMNERNFYSRCVGKSGSEEGVIVDLGCWMGATTTALAEGLSKEEQADSQGVTKIYAFDRFVWETWMDRWLAEVCSHYLPGECFLPEARQNLRQYLGVVQLIKADLTTYVWEDGPIRVLLVDAMKSRELAQSIARTFFPCLSAGGVLIHQDFKHFYTPWIHILQYRLREHFQMLENVPLSGTLAFEALHVVPSEVIVTATDFEHVSDEEVSEAFAFSLDLVGEEGNEAIAAAHVMYFVHAKRRKKSLEVFSQYRTNGVRLIGDLELAKQMLDKLD